jgi:hypothetical protein
VSRTERDTTPLAMRLKRHPCSLFVQRQPAPSGFRPTRPLHAAGMGIDPPPSLACAIGTTPAATNAAERRLIASLTDEERYDFKRILAALGTDPLSLRDP